MNSGPTLWPGRYWFAAAPLVAAVNFALTGLGLVLAVLTLPRHDWLWWFMGALLAVTFLAWWAAARAAAEAGAQAVRLSALHETLGGVAANVGEIKGAHPALAAALEKVSRLAVADPAGTTRTPPSPGQQRFDNWTLRQRKKEMKKSTRAAQKGGSGRKPGAPK